MRNATQSAIQQFTTEQDFNEFLDVGSTPELEKVKISLKQAIAEFPRNVRTTFKSLCESRLSKVRDELVTR